MNDGPRYLAVNGDEGEPGTFKYRYYLERTPHVFLEGMLIAAWVVEAQTCFIYMCHFCQFLHQQSLQCSARQLVQQWAGQTCQLCFSIHALKVNIFSQVV